MISSISKRRKWHKSPTSALLCSKVSNHRSQRLKQLTLRKTRRYRVLLTRSKQMIIWSWSSNKRIKSSKMCRKRRTNSLVSWRRSSLEGMRIRNSWSRSKSHSLLQRWILKSSRTRRNSIWQRSSRLGSKRGQRSRKRQQTWLRLQLLRRSRSSKRRSMKWRCCWGMVVVVKVIKRRFRTCRKLSRNF